MKFKQIIMGMLSALAVVAGVGRVGAQSVGGVHYVDWDRANGWRVHAVADTAVVVTGNMPATFAAGTVYVVQTNVTIADRIMVEGTSANPTRLVLGDGAKLTAQQGFAVGADKALVICAQAGGTGALEAGGAHQCAGIGGDPNAAGGSVTINGGVVTVTGGYGAAGIGGGNVGAGGTVTINGGTVTVNGGDWSAGIGGGYKGDGGSVAINGGTLVVSAGRDDLDGPTTAIGAGQLGSAMGTVTVKEGPFGIAAGTSATTAAEVSAAAFIADHSAKFVQVTPPPAGCAANPWLVGTAGAVNVWTNETTLVIGGSGVVEGLDGIDGWDEFKAELTAVTVVNSSVTGMAGEVLAGVGAAEAPLLLTLVDGWQGLLPDGDGMFAGRKVELAAVPLAVKNVTFQQRYPWNGKVDISVDVTGVGELELQVAALVDGLPVHTATIEGANLDLGSTPCARDGVKLVWDAGADLPAGFKTEKLKLRVQTGTVETSVKTESALGKLDLVAGDRVAVLPQETFFVDPAWGAASEVEMTISGETELRAYTTAGSDAWNTAGLEPGRYTMTLVGGSLDERAAFWKVGDNWTVLDSANLAGNTTFADAQTILVLGTNTVASGATLTVASGVTFHYDGERSGNPVPAGFKVPADATIVVDRSYNVVTNDGLVVISNNNLPGTKANPWPVGTEGDVGAWLDGTELVIEGAGTLGVELAGIEGFAELMNGITAIRVADAGVTEIAAGTLAGLGAETPVALVLPDGWQGELPDGEGNWGGAKVTLAALPRAVKNVVFQGRYPWNGLVDIGWTVTGPEGEQLVQVTVWDGGIKLANFTQTVAIPAGGMVEASAIWDASAQLGDGFRSDGVFVKVSLAQRTKIDGEYMVVDLKANGRGQYAVSYVDEAPAGGWNSDVYKTDKLVFRKVAASDEGYYCEPWAVRFPISTKAPVENDYWIGVFEVTEAQHAKVMGGSTRKTTPMSNISYEAIRGTTVAAEEPASDSILGRLSSKCVDAAGTRLAGFDLPTEVQWEIACRANTQTKYSCGNVLTAEYALFDEAADEPQAVGGKLPNAWGLYDMNGNVWEWCRDVYPDYEAYRIIRGGSYADGEEWFDSSNGDGFVVTEGEDFVGFRLAMTTANSVDGDGMALVVSPLAAKSAVGTLDTRTQVVLAPGEVSVPNVAWSSTAWGEADEAEVVLGYVNELTDARGVLAAKLAATGTMAIDLPKQDGKYVLTHSAGEMVSSAVYMVSGYPLGCPTNPMPIGPAGNESGAFCVTNGVNVYVMPERASVDPAKLAEICGDTVVDGWMVSEDGSNTNRILTVFGSDGRKFDSFGDALNADPLPEAFFLFDVDLREYRVTYDKGEDDLGEPQPAGEMEADVFVPLMTTNLTACAFTREDFVFDHWQGWTNGVEVAYGDGARGIDFAAAGETLALTAKWTRVALWVAVTNLEHAVYTVTTNGAPVETFKPGEDPTVTLFRVETNADVRVTFRALGGYALYVDGNPATSRIRKAVYGESDVVAKYPTVVPIADVLQVELDGSGKLVVTGAEPTADGVLVIPAEIEGVPVAGVGAGAFAFNQDLKEVVIEDGVSEIGGGAFDGCALLERVEIPASVTNIGTVAFSRCSELETVVFGGDAPTFEQPTVPGYTIFSDSSEDLVIQVPEGASGWDSETTVSALCPEGQTLVPGEGGYIIAVSSDGAQPTIVGIVLVEPDTVQLTVGDAKRGLYYTVERSDTLGGEWTAVGEKTQAEADGELVLVAPRGGDRAFYRVVVGER